MNTSSNISANKSIFILDDDKFYLEFINEIVSKYSDSISVKTFTNKNEFYLALNDKPDLIILDFNLGYDNSNRVTAHSVINDIEKYNSNQEIVLLSGEMNLELLEEYNRYRNFEFLVKTSNIKNDIYFLFDKIFQTVIH